MPVKSGLFFSKGLHFVFGFVDGGAVLQVSSLLVVAIMSLKDSKKLNDTL